MLTTDERRSYIESKQTASAARRREALRAAPKGATPGGAMLAVLPLLLVAALVFLALGDARETSWAAEAQARGAAVAATPARAGLSLHGEASGGSAAPADYFPAAYASRGRDGDGNVMTYEHD